MNVYTWQEEKSECWKNRPSHCDIFLLVFISVGPSRPLLFVVFILWSMMIIGITVSKECVCVRVCVCFCVVCREASEPPVLAARGQ